MKERKHANNKFYYCRISDPYLEWKTAILISSSGTTRSSFGRKNTRCLAVPTRVSNIECDATSVPCPRCRRFRLYMFSAYRSFRSRSKITTHDGMRVRFLENKPTIRMSGLWVIEFAFRPQTPLRRELSATSNRTVMGTRNNKNNNFRIGCEIRFDTVFR